MFLLATALLISDSPLTAGMDFARLRVQQILATDRDGGIRQAF